MLLSFADRLHITDTGLAGFVVTNPGVRPSRSVRPSHDCYFSLEMVVWPQVS